MTDMETCSWCVEEVPYSSLKESKTDPGAMICKQCRADEKKDNADA